MGQTRHAEAAASSPAAEVHLPRQPSSANRASVPPTPGAFRVAGRAPNRSHRSNRSNNGGRGRGRGRSQDRGRGRRGQGRGGGQSSSGQAAGATPARCTTAADANANVARVPMVITMEPAALSATRVQSVVQAVDAVVIDEETGTGQQQHNNGDDGQNTIRRKDWIIVGTVIGVTVVVVAVTLAVRLSR